MAKSNKVTKEESLQSKSKKKSLQVSESQSKKQDPRVAQSLKTWHKEISEIKKESFSTLEAAARAVAEKVVGKSSMADGQKARAIELIETALSTDPQMQDYLRKSLKIAE
jgi:hypothetical protein